MDVSERLYNQLADEDKRTLVARGISVPSRGTTYSHGILPNLYRIQRSHHLSLAALTFFVSPQSVPFWHRDGVL